MVYLGQVFLGLSLLGSIVAVAALFWGRSLGPKQGEGVTNFGYFATFGVAISMSIASLTMVAAFFGENFSFLYVAENHSTDASGLAWLYKLSGLWAGREGSLLFWTWVLTLFAAWVAWRRMEYTDDLSNMGLAVTNVMTALFSIAMMFSEPNNPFKITPAELLSNGELVGQAASWGMNPLLQHWAMILHPPTLFIGYAGLTIPFAFAIGALITGDGSKRWVEIVDRITVFSWLFLGAGIGLGSVWAYVVLGWGGYWAWDPVENASLLPWLTGVGLLHSFTVYRRRDGFKRWAVMMAAFTFALVILGTFITRSGIVQSVHAFSEDPLSKYLFQFMIYGSVIIAAIGLRIRWKQFAGNDEFESLTSKEAAYYFNNVIMLVAGLLVAYMTVTSALPSWMPFGGQSIASTSYDTLARPVGVLYLFILAVCPLLSWRSTGARVFWQRIKWPLAGAAVMFGLLLAEWWYNLRPIYDATMKDGGENARKLASFGPQWLYDTITVLAFLAGVLVIATTVALFVEGVRKRMAAKGENVFTALGNILIKARTQSGGYITHIGMGIIVIGLVGSSMYVRDVRTEVKMQEGAKFSVSDYSFEYKGLKTTELSNKDVDVVAEFEVSRDGKKLGTVEPGRTQFSRQGQTRLNATVLSEPLRDIFVVFEGTDQSGENLSMNVKINPLIWFAWGGFGVLLVGTALASWPKRGSEPVPVPASKPVAARGASKSRKR